MTINLSPWDLLRSVLSPSSDLRPADRLVLLSLLQHGDKDDPRRGATVGVRRLAASTGQDQHTVLRALRRLEGCGLITRSMRRGAKTTYIVNIKPGEVCASAQRCADSSAGKRTALRDRTSGARKRTAEVRASAQRTVQLPFTKQQTEADSPASRALNGQGFEAWWMLYRTRTGRGTRKRETRDVYDRLSVTDKAALLKRTEEWFAARDRVKASGAFVAEAPDPVRFLRHRRWEDELDVPTAGEAAVPGGAKNAAFARDQAEHGVDPRWQAYESAIRAGEREPGTWAGFADGAGT